MKKAVILIFAFFYLMMSSGFAINLHYCGGKLKNISLIDNNDKGCCGSKKKSRSCCKNHSLVYKVKTNNTPSSIITPSPIINTLLQGILPHLFNFSIANEPVLTSYYFEPPVLYEAPIYLRNRVLLI